MEVSTELERKLLGALGGFIAMTAQNPDIARDVFKAAELEQADIEATFKGAASDAFNCTMWNACNALIGLSMLTHKEILIKRAEAAEGQIDHQEG